MGVELVEQGVTLCLNQTFDRVAAHGIEIEARAPGMKRVSGLASMPVARITVRVLRVSPLSNLTASARISATRAPSRVSMRPSVNRTLRSGHRYMGLWPDRAFLPASFTLT